MRNLYKLVGLYSCWAFCNLSQIWAESSVHRTFLSNCFFYMFLVRLEFVLPFFVIFFVVALVKSITPSACFVPFVEASSTLLSRVYIAYGMS